MIVYNIFSSGVAINFKDSNLDTMTTHPCTRIYSRYTHIHILIYSSFSFYFRLLTMVSGGAQCSLLWSSAGPLVLRRLAWCSAMI